MFNFEKPLNENTYSYSKKFSYSNINGHESSFQRETVNYKASLDDYEYIAKKIWGAENTGKNEGSVIIDYAKFKCEYKWSISDRPYPQIDNYDIICCRNIKVTFDFNIDIANQCIYNEMCHMKYLKGQQGMSYTFTDEDYETLANELSKQRKNEKDKGEFYFGCEGPVGCYVEWVKNDNGEIEVTNFRGSWKGIGKLMIDADKEKIKLKTCN